MKIAIIGLGKCGTQITSLLIARKENLEIDLFDKSKDLLLGNGRDLTELNEIIGSSEINIMHNRRLVFKRRKTVYDFTVVTAGYARHNLKETDESLFKKNIPIVKEALRKIQSKKIIIVTNPPEMIAENLRETLSVVIPAGGYTDKIRIKLGYDDSSHIFNLIGHTKQGIAGEVIRIIEKESA